jgi:hypothetical protein
MPFFHQTLCAWWVEHIFHYLWGNSMKTTIMEKQFVFGGGGEGRGAGGPKETWFFMIKSPPLLPQPPSIRIDNYWALKHSKWKCNPHLPLPPPHPPPKLPLALPFSSHGGCKIHLPTKTKGWTTFVIPFLLACIIHC